MLDDGRQMAAIRGWDRQTLAAAKRRYWEKRKGWAAARAGFDTLTRGKALIYQSTRYCGEWLPRDIL